MTKAIRVNDFTTENGAIFDVAGGVLSTAIREKVGFLKAAVVKNRSLLAAAIPSIEDAVSILLLVNSPDASAEVSRIRSLTHSINKANKLIDELEREQRHIQENEIYRLGPQEMERYGL